MANAKTSAEGTTPTPATDDRDTQIAELRAQLAALTELVTAPTSKGPLVSQAELEATLGGRDMMTRDESAPVKSHPGTGKPLFNAFRPTGRH